MHTDIDWVTSTYIDDSEVGALTDAVSGMHPLIARLLLQRGHAKFEDVRTFFNPDIETMGQFGELLNVSKASNRLIEAVQSEQSILLYGDYDVDGTCSVSMMYLFLQSLDANVSYYIPDRYSEGYGVSEQGIDFAIDNGIDLLITLDCGITGNIALERATAAGMDVIVCDHHLPGESLPDVFAILNPQQAECNFDGKQLCGCGVGLMLIKRICENIGEPEKWKDYLDYAAIATCCDIVPLTGINRIIVAHGMKLLKANSIPSVSALLGEMKNTKIETVSDIVFKIGPRINAAGRLAHAQEAVELLISADPSRAREMAKRINEYNVDRRTLDADATKEALAQVRAKGAESLRSSTVVCGEDWNKGIIGIVASRLIESHYRPTIVLTESNGKLTGSARSVQGFNIYNAISACEMHLEQFGGHAAAAGLTLEKEKLPAFEQAFENAVASSITNESRKPSIHIDALINFSDWYTEGFKKFLAQLDRFRPFGPYNMPVTFATENCMAKFVKMVGQDHLKFTVYQEGDPQRTLPVIAFKMAGYCDELMAGAKFKLAYSIGENEWNGNTTLQLEAKAIQLMGEV